jgi:hypothetical protein
MTQRKHRPIYINFSLRITAKILIKKMENPKKEDNIKKKEISIMLMTTMISTQRTRLRPMLRKEKKRRKKRRGNS